MIRIETKNENKYCYDLEVHVEGPKTICRHQLTNIFNDLYKADSKLFETALLSCKYTEDHT